MLNLTNEFLELDQVINCLSKEEFNTWLKSKLEHYVDKNNEEFEYQVQFDDLTSVLDMNIEDLEDKNIPDNMLEIIHKRKVAQNSLELTQHLADREARKLLNILIMSNILDDYIDDDSVCFG